MSRSMKKERSVRQRNQRHTTFVYEPLPDVDYLRILEILPGDEKDSISCLLNILEIFVDQRPTYVTVNLADALQAFRHPVKTRLVWADAICINQHDDIEKSHQVKRMGKIYENSNGVLVWLGKDNKGIAEDCFNLVRDTNHYLNTLYDDYGSLEAVPKFTQQCLVSGDKSRWDNVLELVNLPWFSRVWVIQEAALAKRCDLIWGPHRMNIAEICEISCWVGLRQDLSELVGRIGTGKIGNSFFYGHCSYTSKKTWKEDLAVILSQVNEQLKPGAILFLGVLQMGRNLEVSLGVDRVYAFLGNSLARRSNQVDKVIVDPDYSKTVDEVYFETARALLDHPREAPYLLSYVDHHSVECVEGSNFSSWRNGSLSLSAVIFDKLIWTSDIIFDWNLEPDPDLWDYHIQTSGDTRGFVHSLRSQVDYILKTSSQIGQLVYADTQAIKIAFSLTLVRGYPKRDDTVGLVKHQRDFEAYCQHRANAAHPETSKTPQSQHLLGDPYSFMHCMNYLHGRRFGIMQSGSFAIVPLVSQLGDVCCVCPGMHVPLILRPREDGNFGLVGDSYIHDVMGWDDYKEGIMGGKVIMQSEQGGPVLVSGCEQSLSMRGLTS
ncbi:hypothetical protein N431DRAFT_547771 [Stipitochalara longipes BDJ]|nr:hypothetical protein N431DRAFT_547771 [Stipitochalara longipes BDJ]